MINRRQRIQWIVGGGVVLAIAALITWNHKSPRPALPAIVHYSNLPELFNQTLQSMRDKARERANDPEELRKLARLYHANRLFAEARACYKAIAATDPSGLNARDHYYLADIAQNENDLAGAQTELRAVLKTEPKYIPARLTLAEALFKTGQAEEAAKEYTAIVGIEANQPQASLGLARIELQRGDDDAAVSRLEELMASHPESTSGAGLFAQVLERRGESDRAIAFSQWSQQKPELPPDDPWKNALLVDCYDIQRLSLTFEEYFKTGKMNEAVPLLDRLAALDPKGPITMMFAGFSHARALEHITAVREYYNALGNGGDPEKIAPLLVTSLLALGKLDEASTLMADLYSKMPDSMPIAKAYSDVAVRQGNEKLTRALLTKVLQKEPFLQSQNMSLAKILWAAGDRDAAVVCLQRVATVYANDVASRALLGEYYLAKSDPVSALKPLEQAEKYVPAKTPAQQSLNNLLGAAYLQIGTTESEKGDFSAASDYYEKAIRHVPTDLSAYAGKANACVQLKQFGSAADALEKMAALQSDNPTIYLSLGDVTYQDGKSDQARRHWEKALQLDSPGETELRAALNERLSGHITAETFK